jgi:hypothetical protein
MERFDVLKWDKSDLVFVTGVLIFVFGITFFQLKIGEMKTRDMQRRTDAELIGRALVKYKTDYGLFPVEATGSGKIYACGEYGEGVCEWNGGPMLGPDNSVLLNKIPGDPFEARGRKYVYEANSDRSKFRLYVGLENSRDKIVNKGLTIECGLSVQCNWYVEN